MADRETGNLIGSDKVEGTAVYGVGRTQIGSIKRVMIDKLSGKVAYAVLSFSDMDLLWLDWLRSAAGLSLTMKALTSPWHFRISWLVRMIWWVWSVGLLIPRSNPAT